MARHVPALALCLALGLAASSLSLSRPAFAADVAITDEARSHFTAGVTFLQDPDGARYEEALREFQTAYAISPSWKILGNLGLAAMKLERDGEARDAIRRYLSEGGEQIEAEERSQMERDLQSIEASIVTLQLEAPNGAVVIDERQPLTGSIVVNRYGPLSGPLVIGIRAGHHKLTARLDGHAEQSWELEAKPRSSESHRFELSAAATAPVSQPAPASAAAPRASSGGGLRVASYVALGVGAAGLAVGTVFAVKAKGKYDEANELCPGSACSLHQSEADQRLSLADEGDSAKTLSLVGFIAGGVGVAAGVTLLVLSSGSREDAPAASAYVGPNGFGLRGRF